MSEELTDLDRAELEQHRREIEAYLPHYRKAWVNAVKIPQDSRQGKLTRNCFILLQQILERSFSLTEGAVEARNSKNALSLALCTRAHLETTGLLLLLRGKMKPFMEKQYSEKILEEFVTQALRATKSIRALPDGVTPPNPILTPRAIDALEEFYSKNGGVKGGVRLGYEVLCDFCHPNYHGLTYAKKQTRTEWRFHRFNERFDVPSASILPVLNTSLFFFAQFYREVRVHLESLPDFPELV